ncbi:hypothetical protein JTE90_019553 [Oedothorax gibbosus]|uniref:Uncharacterized protein n=1 Tax=Oedothorax gibbosus TaxID=931172 RepID=A0AAV6TND4_9ARAC|nr:hypothetical protein JTE90_019553 [Oedothorax gibbosus]
MMNMKRKRASKERKQEKRLSRNGLTSGTLLYEVRDVRVAKEQRKATSIVNTCSSSWLSMSPAKLNPALLGGETEQVEEESDPFEPTTSTSDSNLSTAGRKKLGKKSIRSARELNNIENEIMHALKKNVQGKRKFVFCLVRGLYHRYD